jgi:hypothetical protein
MRMAVARFRARRLREINPENAADRGHFFTDPRWWATQTVESQPMFFTPFPSFSVSV